MENLNWGAIGAIAGVVGVGIAVIQIFKKDKPTNDNKTTQSIRGLFLSKNNISQKIEKKDER